MWEDICKWPGKALVSKIYKELIKLTPKMKNPIKNRQKTWTDISPKKTSRRPTDMKRCSSSLTIREMQIKTRKIYHLISVRMAKINNTRNNRCWWRCGKTGTLLHCWWECKLLQPLWKTARRFLKKLKIELPCNLAIVLLGI